MSDIIITPASGKIDFYQDLGAASLAKIELTSTNDLALSTTSGNLIIGDASRDIYIGNGINDVDIIFEQNGEIRPLPAKTLNIGTSGSFTQILASKVNINQNSFTSIPLDVYSSTSGATILNVAGTKGTLFSVTDNLSGSLMSVNNDAGLPVFEVFSDDRVVAGRFGQNDFIMTSGGNVGIGTSSPVSKLQVSGLVTANSGNFTNSLTVNSTGVSISGHTHTSSDISNFNSSVSGLLPTITNSGDNRVLTSTGGSVGVNAESNLTFNGSLLSVTGSGIFSSGIIASNISVTGNIISATNSNGNLIIKPNASGALQADDTGNSRGIFSVDLQRSRTSVSGVAHGEYSVIGGGRNNRAAGNDSTIGGGGSNSAGDIYSTVGGGTGNSAGGGYGPTIGGGMNNTASGGSSTIGGGGSNTASGDGSTVAGGTNNTAGGYKSTVGGGTNNSAGGNYGPTVGGGTNNSAGGYRSTVSGGMNNTAGGSQSTIGGGYGNSAGGDYASTVGGGTNNTASGGSSTIGGGGSNTASGTSSTVGGGTNNSASGNRSTVGGGNANTAGGSYSTVGGGTNNSASGNRSTVGGGQSNTAGDSYSTVGGGQSNTAGGGYSVVPGGCQAKATRYGEISHSAGRFGNDGDAQHTILIARNVTTNATAAVLFLDGSSSRLTIPAETTWIFTTKLSAYNDTDNLSAGYNIRGCIRRNAASGTSIIGSNIVESWSEGAMSGCVATATADTTNQALQINVIGLASKNIRWVAVVDISQVSYGTP